MYVETRCRNERLCQGAPLLSNNRAKFTPDVRRAVHTWWLRPFNVLHEIRRRLTYNVSFALSIHEGAFTGRVYGVRMAVTSPRRLGRVARMSKPAPTG